MIPKYNFWQVALVFAVVYLCCSGVHGNVVLQPRGVELLCPNPGGVGRTLVCNVTGSIIMRIDVSVRGGTSQTVFYTTSQGASNAPTTLQGVMVSVLTSSSSRLTAQLVLPDQVDLLPVSIECSDGRIDTVLMYSLKYMELPDAPGALSLMESSSSDHVLRWPPPSIASKPVDSYIISIRATATHSPPQTFTSETTSVTVPLLRNTTYSMSVRARNCAGDSSMESTLQITTSTEAVAAAITSASPNVKQTTAPEQKDTVTHGSQSLQNPSSFTTLAVTPWLVGLVTMALFCLIFSIITFVVGFMCGWKHSRKHKYLVQSSVNGRAAASFSVKTVKDQIQR